MFSRFLSGLATNSEMAPRSGPELAQLVRTRIAVDAVEGSMEIVGQGSVAVMM